MCNARQTNSANPKACRNFHTNQVIALHQLEQFIRVYILYPSDNLEYIWGEDCHSSSTISKKLAKEQQEQVILRKHTSWYLMHPAYIPWSSSILKCVIVLSVSCLYFSLSSFGFLRYAVGLRLTLALRRSPWFMNTFPGEILSWARTIAWSQTRICSSVSWDIYLICCLMIATISMLSVHCA